jgi:hypothetical protein
VISVNYQRSEYTAITLVSNLGRVRIVAHCPVSCPETLGTYDAGPESTYFQPDIISRPELAMYQRMNTCVIALSLSYAARVLSAVLLNPDR